MYWPRWRRSLCFTFLVHEFKTPCTFPIAASVVIPADNVQLIAVELKAGPRSPSCASACGRVVYTFVNVLTPSLANIIAVITTLNQLKLLVALQKSPYTTMCSGLLLTPITKRAPGSLFLRRTGNYSPCRDPLLS
ncbi:hypothetical protein Plhal304r1_c068g0155831 [Plasmopara halstedii]